MSQKKRVNYTPREKELLIALAEKYSSVLENKSSEVTAITKKNEAWSKIADQFNASTESGLRDAQQLRELYRNLKRKAKKSLAEVNKRKYIEAFEDDEEVDVQIAKKKSVMDKRETGKTGGGSYSSQLSEPEARVLAILDNQIHPLCNPYDDNAVYNDDVTVIHIDEDVAVQEPAPVPNFPITNEAQPRNSSTSQRKPQLKKAKKMTKTESLKNQFYKIKLQCAKLQLSALKWDLKIKKEQYKQLQKNNP